MNLIYLLLLGPILFVVVSWILGLITPDYDWKNDYISELVLGKYGWVQKLNFWVCGVSVSGICILLAGMSPILLVKLGWYIGSALGVVTALAGVWDTDVKRPLKTVAGRLHDYTYHVGILGTGFAYILVGWGYRSFPVILVFSWAVAAFDLIWWNFSEKLGIKQGVGQRMVIYSALLWIEVMAIWTMWR